MGFFKEWIFLKNVIQSNNAFIYFIIKIVVYKPKRVKWKFSYLRNEKGRYGDEERN